MRESAESNEIEDFWGRKRKLGHFFAVKSVNKGQKLFFGGENVNPATFSRSKVSIKAKNYARKCGK